MLYPVLSRTHVTARERRIIALFGPRGLSSLLLTLLPVFAGIPGAERLFSVACLVVLCSIVLHGGGITYFLRRNRPGVDVPPAIEVTLAAAALPAATGIPVAPATPVPQPVQRSPLPIAENREAGSYDKITIDEFRRLQQSDEEVIVVDARADRSFRQDDLKAVGSVRLNPDHPVQDAKALRLSQRATLVVFCA